MSKALNTLINKNVVKVIKNTAKLELAVDDLIEKFKKSCPPKPELLQIVKQKNQLQEGLESILGAFQQVETAASVTNTIVTTVSAAVTTIKLIPVPTSVPPGVGVPINVITILADSLDTLGDILKGAKGALSVVPPVSGTITGAASSAIAKLQELDILLNACIEELAEGMTQTEKNNLIDEVGLVAASAGDFSSIPANLLDESLLEERLNPNSDNPYLYQKTGFPTADWQLIVEYNAENKFSFPERRIKAVNILDAPETNIYQDGVVFNLPNGDYSYSNSVKILIEEAKYQIELLGENFYNPAYTPPSDIVIPEGKVIVGYTDEGEPIFEDASNTSGTSIGNIGIKKIVIPSSLEKISLPITENNNDNIITANLVKTYPYQRVRVTADTGRTNVPGSSNPYFSGRFELIIGVSKSGELGSPEIITLTPFRERVKRTLTLGDPGTYVITVQIKDQEDILLNSDAFVSFTPIP